MAEGPIPDAAVRAAADAISRLLFSGQPEYGTWMEHDEDLARAAVVAAAPHLTAEIAQRAETAEATIARIRKLHRGPRTQRHGSGCVQCGLVWPCPTARALDGA